MHEASCRWPFAFLVVCCASINGYNGAKPNGYQFDRLVNLAIRQSSNYRIMLRGNAIPLRRMSPAARCRRSTSARSIGSAKVTAFFRLSTV